MIRTRCAIPLLFPIVLFLAGQAFAQDSVSMAKLRVAVEKAEEYGYTHRERAQGRFLAKGESFTVNTTLYEGNRYMIIGAGDDNIRDLDIELYDENWNLVDKDRSPDPVPIVNVIPRWTGTFHLKVVACRGQGYANIAICYMKQ